MAVTSVKQKHNERPATATWQGREYTLVYVVVCNADDTEADVLDHFSFLTGGTTPNEDTEGKELPWPRRIHTAGKSPVDDTYALCDTLTVDVIRRWDGTDKYYLATAKYLHQLLRSNVTSAETPNLAETYDPSENYLNVELEAGYRHEIVRLEQDLDGEYFVNSAGEPIVYEERQSYRTFSISQNLAYGANPQPNSLTAATGGYDIRMEDIFINAVNDEVWPGTTGYPVGTLIISDIKRTLEYKGGVWYWHRSVTVDYRPINSQWPTGWQASYLDRGFQVLDDTTPTPNRVNAKDANGDEVATEILLNGSGKALPVDGTKFHIQRRTRPTRTFKTFFGFDA